MKTKHLTMTALLGLTPALVSCSSDDNPGLLPYADPIVLKGEYQTKTMNSRSFAIDLFKTVAAESAGKNLFISPYSVNTALSMLWNGAAGETADEISAVLGNETYTREQINDYSKTLTEALLNIDPSTEMKIANSIWADISTPFKQTFVQTNQTYYNAEVKNVDFTNTGTFDVIDRWCRENTNGRIDKISEGMSEDTKFALINAIYFKGKWRHEFSKSDTKKETFANANGSQATVEMMNMKEDFLYADDDQNWKMLNLPYGNAAFSMLVLMPYADEPLDEMLPTLTTGKFYSLLEAMDTYPVTVKLPKFKAEYSYELQEKTLPSMGMVQVFNPDAANLSEMCEDPMFVSMVMHKTFIAVDEDGTEAAAATSVSGLTTSLPSGTPVYFYADRPFIYSIVEKSTGTILFMGRINSF